MLQIFQLELPKKSDLPLTRRIALVLVVAYCFVKATHTHVKSEPGTGKTKINRAMFRKLCTGIAPRVATASRSRTAPLASLLASSNGPHLVTRAGGGNALEFVVAASSEHSCSWRRTLSSSSNAKMAGGDGEEVPREGGEGMGSGRDSRDPETGEGIWIDDEDEVG